MAPAADETKDETNPSLRSVTFKLSAEDIERLKRIVKRRYPEDRHMMAKTLRELIREEYTRGSYEETPGK